MTEVQTGEIEALTEDTDVSEKPTRARDRRAHTGGRRREDVEQALRATKAWSRLAREHGVGAAFGVLLFALVVLDRCDSRREREDFVSAVKDQTAAIRDQSAAIRDGNAKSAQAQQQSSIAILDVLHDQKGTLETLKDLVQVQVREQVQKPPAPAAIEPQKPPRRLR